MPALPPLATAAELAQRTGRPASDGQLLAALVDASRRFREAVNHPVSLTQWQDYELDGGGARDILLPGVPIVSVSSFTLTDGGAELVRGRDYSLSTRTGILRRLGGRCWPDELGFALISFTTGYDATTTVDTGGVAVLEHVPEGIQGAILDMSQVLLNIIPGLQGRTVLGDSVQFGAAASVGTTQTWTDAVNGYALAKGDRA